MRERIRKAKSRGETSSVEINKWKGKLNKKKIIKTTKTQPTAHTSETSQIINHQQVNGQPQQYPLPPKLLLSKILKYMEYLFSQFGSEAPAVSPHNLLPTPSLLARAVEWENKRPWHGVSAIQQQLKHWRVHQQFVTISNTAPYGLLRGKLTPSQPNLVPVWPEKSFSIKNYEIFAFKKHYWNHSE